MNAKELLARKAQLEAELAQVKSEIKTVSKPKVTDMLKVAVLEAIKKDPKTTNGRYYASFAAFIIAQAVKKYGTSAQVKDATWLSAAAGYGIK